MARPARLELATPSLEDRKSTRLNSSHGYISYAVFCLKKKKFRHTATHAPHPMHATASIARTASLMQTSRLCISASLNFRLERTLAHQFVLAIAQPTPT